MIGYIDFVQEQHSASVSLDFHENTAHTKNIKILRETHPCNFFTPEGNTHR